VGGHRPPFARKNAKGHRTLCAPSTRFGPDGTREIPVGTSRCVPKASGEERPPRIHLGPTTGGPCIGADDWATRKAAKDRARAEEAEKAVEKNKRDARLKDEGALASSRNCMHGWGDQAKSYSGDSSALLQGFEHQK